MAITWCFTPEIWSLIDKIFCHFGPFFALTPLATPKINILKKWKKTSGDIIMLHSYTINDNHMLYGSWDMEHDRQNSLLFWTFFCPFTPLTTWKIKLLKKWKKAPGHIIILHKCPKNHDYKLHYCWDMTHEECNFYFSFCTIFCPFTLLTTQKIKIKKKMKTMHRYHFMHVYQNYDHIMYGSSNMVHNRWTDGWMDNWTHRKSDR